MSSLAWFFTIYGIIGLLTVRPVAGALAWRMYDNYHYQQRGPSLDQWFGAGGIAACAALVWPIMALFFLQGRSKKLTFGAERQAILRAQDDRIKQLERALEISEER